MRLATPIEDSEDVRATRILVLYPAMSSGPTARDMSGVLRDADLFDKMRAGERSAFSDFYDRYATLLYSIAARVLGDRREAEDVLQEVMLQIWRRPEGYDPELGSVSSWAVALTRNRAIDRLRSASRRGRLADAVAHEGPVIAATPSANEIVHGRERSEQVRSALGELPQEQREAIELAFFAGLSQSEIAARLDQPLGTIKARIRRGMLKLRERLGSAP